MPHADSPQVAPPATYFRRTAPRSDGYTNTLRYGGTPFRRGERRSGRWPCWGVGRRVVGTLPEFAGETRRFMRRQCANGGQKCRLNVSCQYGADFPGRCSLVVHGLSPSHDEEPSCLRYPQRGILHRRAPIGGCQSQFLGAKAKAYLRGEDHGHADDRRGARSAEFKRVAARQRVVEVSRRSRSTSAPTSRRTGRFLARTRC
jgi:hypothetical protein